MGLNRLACQLLTNGMNKLLVFERAPEHKSTDVVVQKIWFTSFGYPSPANNGIQGYFGPITKHKMDE